MSALHAPVAEVEIVGVDNGGGGSGSRRGLGKVLVGRVDAGVGGERLEVGCGIGGEVIESWGDGGGREGVVDVRSRTSSYYAQCIARGFGVVVRTGLQLQVRRVELGLLVLALVLVRLRML
jgi:hypothetical protein